MPSHHSFTCPQCGGPKSPSHETCHLCEESTETRWCPLVASIVLAILLILATLAGIIVLSFGG